MGSELRSGGFQVVFKLVGRAVAYGGVAAAQVEVGVEVPGNFQLGFWGGRVNQERVGC